MECTKCQKIFTRSDNLRRHMKIHNRYISSEAETETKCLETINKKIMELNKCIINYLVKEKNKSSCAFENKGENTLSETSCEESAKTNASNSIT